MISGRIFGVVLAGLVALNAAIPDSPISLRLSADVLQSHTGHPSRELSFYVAGPIDDQPGLAHALEKAGLTESLLLLLVLLAGLVVFQVLDPATGRFDCGFSARSPPLIAANLRLTI